jgi:tRNA pseudouridine-54 N-methylase
MERRSDGPRLALEATALITIDVLSPAIYSRIVNASHRGMQLVMPDSRPVGTRIRVTVRIDEPQREITVSGIIVHTSTMESIDPRLTSRIGIFLTETGEDWRTLCDNLAHLAPKKAR